MSLLLRNGLASGARCNRGRSRCTGTRDGPSAGIDNGARSQADLHRPGRATPFFSNYASGITTRSAKPGDGVYLASNSPLLSVLASWSRPEFTFRGLSTGWSAPDALARGDRNLDMHFTSIIFPNGTVVEIPGIVNAPPGAHKQTVKDDGEGTIERQNGAWAATAAKTAEIAIPTGGTVGSIGALRLQGIPRRWHRRHCVERLRSASSRSLPVAPT